MHFLMEGHNTTYEMFLPKTNKKPGNDQSQEQVSIYKKKKKKLRDKETCKIKPHKCNYEDPDGDTLVEK